MHLLEGAFLPKDQRRVRLRAAIGLGERLRLELAEMILCKLDQFLVREAAGRGDQNIFGRVIAVVITIDAVAVEAANGLTGPQNRTPQGMPLPEIAREDLMDEIFGIIHIHLQFFEDDAFFLLDVALLKQRISYQVRHDAESVRQMLVEYFYVV